MPLGEAVGSSTSLSSLTTERVGLSEAAAREGLGRGVAACASLRRLAPVPGPMHVPEQEGVDSAHGALAAAASLSPASLTSLDVSLPRAGPGDGVAALLAGVRRGYVPLTSLRLARGTPETFWPALRSALLEPGGCPLRSLDLQEVPVSGDGPRLLAQAL